MWKFRTGTAWRDVPERYGSWTTLHTRFRRWAGDGTFERMLRAAQARADAAGDLEWLVSVDSTVVRAHQHAVMNAIRVPRSGPGRPRTRPAHVLGDKGYSSKAIRTWLRWRSIGHTIPEGADQVRNRLRRGSRGGRPPAFDRQLYKQRNVVERCFNRLKQWRGIATRYDKTAESYQAAIALASLPMWTLHLTTTPRAAIERPPSRRARAGSPVAKHH
ncbi:putative transposase of IS4/5 family DUF4096 [Streptomyces sp. Amel2xB2]|nr:putative transposase of IS4/5 family DUF4096 [Streptomyces sp. Amel2xB2]